MKLVLIIVSSHNVDPLIAKLTEAGYRVTVAATAGGFLQRHNATIFTLAENEQVEKLMEMVDHVCESPPASRFSRSGLGTRNVGRATVFVLDVEEFENIPGLTPSTTLPADHP